MKNTVTVDAENRIVTKAFRSRIAFENEVKVLKLFSGTGYVPEFSIAENNKIVMDYCSGKTLSEICSTQDRDEIICVFRSFADDLERFAGIFHEKTGKYITLQDFNPRNFLVSDGKTIFIDFEARKENVKDINFTLLTAMLMNMKFADGTDRDRIISEITAYASEICGINTEDLINSASSVYEANETKKKLRSVLRNAKGCILAGGHSSRMGGNPKGLIDLGGFTFADHLIYALQPLDDIFISANLDVYSSFGLQIVKDEYLDAGPLSGLYSAMKYADSEWIFVVPCDMPFISENLVYTARQAVIEGYDAAVFESGERIYPTFGIYRAGCMDIVRQQLEKKDYRLRNMLERINYTVFTSVSDEHGVNINTPDDLRLLNK